MKYLYCVPLWLMKKYLIDLGGVEIEENVLAGQGWRASVCKCEPVRIGSLVSGRIEVDIMGEEAVVASLMDKLNLKALRGGG